MPSSGYCRSGHDRCFQNYFSIDLGFHRIIKLKNCTNIGELTANEATDIGRVIKKTSNIINKLLQPDQIYVCMWAHASWVPGHIHFVIQPAWNKLKTKHKKTGPFLQVDMYKDDVYPDRKEVLSFVKQAKILI